MGGHLESICLQDARQCWGFISDMMTRRQFVLSATGSGAMLGLNGCSSGTAQYDEAVRATWRHTAGALSGDAALMRELVRYATLAASSHNTQCWKFRINNRAISILPDLSRRLVAVDPDDHHLFVSLGCAAENLLQAARANGFHGDARFDAAASSALQIALEPTKAIASRLYDAIPKRQCTRGEYDGKPLSNEDLKLLEQAGTGNGVRVILLTEKTAMEKVLEYVVQSNTAQMDDPAFVAELKAWIRFGNDEAVTRGDGLFAKSSGNPVMPPWLGSPLFNLFFTTKNENEKYAKRVRSSAGIAVFVSGKSDKQHWLEAGRCYERFALQATALDIRNAFLNQPVEVSTLRPQFANYLGIGTQRPDLVVRFGRGPEMPRSLRRPVDAVIV
jgi:hypothetical protein